MKTLLLIAVLLLSITSSSQSMEEKILLEQVKKRGIKTNINWSPEIGGFNFERKSRDYQIIYDLRVHIKDSLYNVFNEAKKLKKAKEKLEKKIFTLNRLVEEHGTIYVTGYSEYGEEYNYYKWSKEDEEYLTPLNKGKMASYDAKMARIKDEEKKFAISFLENFKIKYGDYVIKCYRENKDNYLRENEIMNEFVNEYEKAFDIHASKAPVHLSNEAIREVMIEIREEFKNSKEYKEKEAIKNSRLKAGIAELNKAQKAYNYNLTHLEKFSTSELREMYMSFKDKRSFQTEAELVRIELLKRK